MENRYDNQDDNSDVEFYGDPGIASKDAPVPRWLVINNWCWIALGFACLYFFWNGSQGWLDRGYWQQLQRAANTTYPYTTWKSVEREAAEKKELTSDNHGGS